MRNYAIKVVIVAIFLLLTVFQFLSIPGQFRYLAEQEPENAYLRWPLTALGFIAILSLQITLFSLWRLIDEIRGDRPFTESSLRRIRVMKFSLFGFLSILALALAFVLSRADDPGMPMVLILISGTVTLLALVIFEIESFFARQLEK